MQSACFAIFMLNFTPIIALSLYLNSHKKLIFENLLAFMNFRKSNFLKITCYMVHILTNTIMNLIMLGPVC